MQCASTVALQILCLELDSHVSACQSKSGKPNGGVSGKAVTDDMHQSQAQLLKRHVSGLRECQQTSSSSTLADRDEALSKPI